MMPAAQLRAKIMAHETPEERIRREAFEEAAEIAEQHARDAVTIDALIAQSIASALRWRALQTAGAKQDREA